MDTYEKKYKEALERARVIHYNEEEKRSDMEWLFPELKESEDERIRKGIFKALSKKDARDVLISQGVEVSDALAWLEKQGNREIDYSQNHQDSDHPNGCIVLEDFNGGEGFYKVNLDYLNKKQIEEIEKMVKVWNKESNSPNENIKDCIGMCLTDADEQRFKDYNTNLKDCLNWLEKQVEPTDKGEISDGYHTFNELYYYRMLYNAAFFNMLPKEWVHKSKKHHDGEECFGGGWFIVMANLPTGQISNHYELKDWNLFRIPEKEVADKWDGHTPQEAADRLYKYLLEKQGEQKDFAPKVEPNA